MQVSMCQNDPRKNHLLRLLLSVMTQKSQGKLPFFGRSTSCRAPFPFPTFPSNYSDTRTKTSFRPSKNIDPKNSRVVMRNFDRESADWHFLKIVLGKPKLRPQFKRHRHLPSVARFMMELGIGLEKLEVQTWSRKDWDWNLLRMAYTETHLLDTTIKNNCTWN